MRMEENSPSGLKLKRIALHVNFLELFFFFFLLLFISHLFNLSLLCQATEEKEVDDYLEASICKQEPLMQVRNRSLFWL